MTVTRSTLRATIDDQGYVIIPGLVPRASLDAVVADIWRHTGADPDERES